MKLAPVLGGEPATEQLDASDRGPRRAHPPPARRGLTVLVVNEAEGAFERIETWLREQAAWGGEGLARSLPWLRAVLDDPTDERRGARRGALCRSQPASSDRVGTMSI